MAAVAIQKLALRLRLLDCFGAEAPRNDAERPELTAAGIISGGSRFSPRPRLKRIGANIRFPDLDGIPIGTSDRRVEHFGAGFGVAKL